MRYRFDDFVVDTSSYSRSRAGCALSRSYATAFLGEPARAKRHFEDAIALNETLGALPQVARTYYEYARWLTPQQQHSTSARHMRQRAVEIAEQLGMRDLAACAHAL